MIEDSIVNIGQRKKIITLNALLLNIQISGLSHRENSYKDQIKIIYENSTLIDSLKRVFPIFFSGEDNHEEV